MIRIGVDFGGTKIEAAALDGEGAITARLRAPNPGDYGRAITAVADLVARVEQAAGARAEQVGVGMPGSISPRTGLIRNANSVWLNGEHFGADLEAALLRPVRLANDANCLALSEAADGAGAGARVVFAAILGTGCGGGVVVDGRLIEGRNGVAGEWGHSPMPWSTPEEHPGPACWCGRRGCLETWISGPAFEADYGAELKAPEIMARARTGDATAQAAFARYVDRLGRALAVVVDLIDPDVIVLGGGMSNVAELYARLPDALAPHVFADGVDTPIRQAVHGDSSGVRGAAWLWPLPAP
ncbi:ROK family protein [Phenylobacterium sp.]|uniref:ROK family protein n=1 Tax=Phenylobacterium sp. TaxID=1871053 RepID=UPI002730DB70|nr:ROK family protein [Phenylobacterium sp.]MDP1616541.1 ROK family protein [Phenylobacterium sp.]MDP1987952.1 ROK family protein [Phenylobacterium sp.]